MAKRSSFIIMLLILCSTWFTACSEKEPNVILITIDTLRADRLGCYGDEKIKTPHIDRLAREGILFSQCLTSTPITLPSHASILTGTYPIYHGVHENGIFKLDPRFTTLAEVLKHNGYQTGAFVSAQPLKSKFGLNQGFDMYDDEEVKHGPRKFPFYLERDAGTTTTRALNWMNSRDASPFFLWVHYFDPHALYNPPEPYKSDYEGDLYSGEIAYVDEHIGRLIQSLEENNLYEETLIVVTSDHGESLNEHRETTHSIFIYDSTMHVPLIFRLPQSEHGGRSFQALVRTIDIMPTILDFLKLKEWGENIQGLSLTGLFRGEKEDVDRLAYIESESPMYQHNWAPLRGVRSEKYKFIHAPKPELYSLKSDPEELYNLYDEGNKEAEEWRGEFFRIKKYYSNRTFTSIDNKVAMDDESLAQLQSLGYLHSNLDISLPDESLPDPKDKMLFWSLAGYVMTLLEQDKFNEAGMIMQTITKLDPLNVTAYQYQGYALLGDDRYEEAIEVVETLRFILRQNGLDATKERVYFTLSVFLHEKGKIRDAIQRLEDITSHQNAPRGSNEFLGIIYKEEGRYLQAEEAFLNEISVSDSVHSRIKLGKLYLAQKRYHEAIQQYLVVSEQIPGDPSYHLRIGSAYFYLDNYPMSMIHLEKARALGGDVPESVLSEINKFAAQIKDRV